MIIWGALAIPIVLAVVKLLYFQKKTLWWEFLIPFAVSLLLIMLLKFSVEKAQVSDTEYWGGWAVTSEHYEDWDERVPCTHAKYETYTDSDGNTQTRFVGYEHAYDVDYHPEYWVIQESNGAEIRVSQSTFESLAARWRNRGFVELHRNYHLDDGDKYVTRWPGDDRTLEPVVTEHSWENRVQAASSVFNFQEVPKDTIKTYELYGYPEVNGYHQVAILGDGGPTQPEAERALQVANAKLGAAKKVKMYILIFKNKPLEASHHQEALWKGGNKNEFVVTIGINDQYEVQWSRVISWTNAETLKVATRDWIGQTFTDKRKPLDLPKIVEWLQVNIPRDFERRDFREFSYLSVEPPLWGILVAYFVTLIVNLGLSAWIVCNQFEESERPWPFSGSRRRMPYP